MLYIFKKKNQEQKEGVGCNFKQGGQSCFNEKVTLVVRQKEQQRIEGNPGSYSTLRSIKSF